MFKYIGNNPVIRERDADGVLTTAGFEWREPVMFVYEIFGTGGLVLYFYWLACASDARTPTDFTSMVFLAMIGCVLMCLCFGHVRRGIAFTRDGIVSIRGGWSNWLLLWGEIKEHAHIASIEATKTEQGAGVAILTTYGGTVMLAYGMSEPAARLAAVQLTMALREMRESLTSIANFQMPQQAATAASWID